MPRFHRVASTAAAGLLAVSILAACGDDDDGSSAGTSSTTSGPATTGTDATVASTTAPAPDDGLIGEVTAEGISPERCQANRDAGTITYLSGFDFAATASIVEVVVAEEKGYFDEMCLDVELKSSFSTQNYPLIAANQAQFASGGSYSEVVDFSSKNDNRLVVVAVEGKTGIDALVVNPESGVQELADLEGKTIGVKGKITPSVKAMLAEAGLVEGEDYTTVLLDGFDPKAHIQQPVAGFPVYKSNEPLQLEAAGIPFELFNPSEQDIPGSFGILYTNKTFLDEHPTAVQDFLRASMKGMADAIANPQEAVAMCLELIKAGGNKNFLSDEGESARWQVESKILEEYTPAGQGLGLVVPDQLQQQLAALTDAGVFAEEPSVEGTVSELISGVYDGTEVIWPA